MIISSIKPEKSVFLYWFRMALLSLMVIYSSTAFAQTAGTPSIMLTDRVVDHAGILSPEQKQALVTKLADYEKESSDQIVVVTVASLNGIDAELYANQLYRAWRIGQKSQNNGILLLVAPNERKVRIEVGYGLEGTMTDALSSIIIQNAIIPEFRSGDYGAGVIKGVDDILQVLHGEGEELQARARLHQQNAEDQTDWLEVIFLIFWVGIFFGGFGFMLLAPIFGRKIAPGRYEWLGVAINLASIGNSGGGGYDGGSSGSSGGGSSGGGGFSGGGGSSGGGGASGSW